jgi:hypothetical protein
MAYRCLTVTLVSCFAAALQDRDDPGGADRLDLHGLPRSVYALPSGPRLSRSKSEEKAVEQTGRCTDMHNSDRKRHRQRQGKCEGKGSKGKKRAVHGKGAYRIRWTSLAVADMGGDDGKRGM